jgi:hypothetical protein
MNKKVFTIFTGYILLTVTTGLISCVDDCGPFPDKFKVTSIDWNTYKVTLTTDNLTLSEITNGVTFNQLGIDLKPKTQTYFSFIINSLSLTTGLYACSPLEPTTDDKTIDIKITANKDFTEEYPQGTDLSGLFDIVISDWYRGIYADKYDLKEYLQTTPFVTQEMTLILKSAPQTTDEYRFTVKYFQDGVDLDYSEFTTNNILVIK